MRMRRYSIVPMLAGTALLAAAARPSAVAAQDSTLNVPAANAPGSNAFGGRSFTLMPHVGVLAFSKFSGLESGPAIGLDARYELAPRLSLGTSVTLSRANTRGSDFITALRYGDPSKGDTTFIFRLQQPVTMLDASLNATFAVPSFTTRLEPYVTGGAGLYRFFIDPQANAGTSRDFSRLSALLGGGVRVRVSQAAGITFDVRDHVLTNFDRDRLAPSDARFRRGVYPEDFPAPPAARDVVHNLLYSVGFTWTPARAQGEVAP
jgi:hypothetical protein